MLLSQNTVYSVLTKWCYQMRPQKQKKTGVGGGVCILQHQNSIFVVKSCGKQSNQKFKKKNHKDSLCWCDEMLEQWSVSLGQHSFSWGNRVLPLLGPSPEMMPVSINFGELAKTLLPSFKKRRMREITVIVNYFVRAEGEDAGLSAQYHFKKSKFLTVLHAWIYGAI